MIAKSDIIPVSEFIRESERNIEIASAIYESFESARAKIAAVFCEKLEADLKRKLPGWKFEFSPFFDGRYGGFAFYKPNWTDRYRVRLECYDWGKKMIYGVWRKAESLKGIAPDSELLAAVRRKLPSATSRSYFEAEIRMTSPATDWRKPKVLWRMQSDDEFRKEVGTLLLEVAELTGKRVDILARKR